MRQLSRIAVMAAALTALAGADAAAQGNGRGRGQEHHQDPSQVTVSVVLSAAREVLVAQGFEVLRVEVVDGAQVVYYRAGNRGRGRGHGPPARMVIRRTEERIVLEDAPVEIKASIELKIGIRL